VVVLKYVVVLVRQDKVTTAKHRISDAYMALDQTSIYRANLVECGSKDSIGTGVFLFYSIILFSLTLAK